MPRLNKERKEWINKLDYNELQDIVLKFASKEESVYNYQRKFNEETN